MKSWPGIFQIPSFLSVVLSESKNITASKTSSIPSNSFYMLIYLTFLSCYFCSFILLQKFFFSFAFGHLFLFIFSPPNLVVYFFSWFCRVLFCLYCLIQSRYLLLSIFSGLFLLVVLSVLSAFFPFFVVCLVFTISLFVLLVSFPIQL